jgi:Domain of unknown function (DUF4112)
VTYAAPPQTSTKTIDIGRPNTIYSADTLIRGNTMTAFAAASKINRSVGLARIRRISQVMDMAWRIPGTKFRFGADSVIGLVPGAGDLVTMGVSLYVLAEAHRMGAPKSLLLKMAGNTAIDSGIGAIPLVGDVFDMFFKSNTKNAKLLLEHFEKHHRA